MQKEPVVIFTSCDENYFKHIPTLVMSIHEYMSQYEVRLFFLHTGIKEEEIAKVCALCDKLNISFEAILIEGETLEKYRILKKLSSTESTFPAEGYLVCLPNLHLPEDVDRALYLDAGDVILAGDIADFYYSDFKGNMLTVSKGFASSWAYTSEDLYDRSKYLEIAAEYFNSGSVLFNVALMRRMNINFDYYISILKLVRNIHDGYNWNTFGGGKRYVVHDDQGLLGVSFVGSINFYDPTNQENINTSYNFRPFVIECNKAKISNSEQLSLEMLKPKIIHLLGNKPGTSQEKRNELLQISKECLALWDKFEGQARKLMEDLK